MAKVIRRHSKILLASLLVFGMGFLWYALVDTSHASQVTNRSDTLNNAGTSATSNHTIAFTVQNNITSQGGLTASSNFSIAFSSDFNLSALTCNDLNLTVAGTATSLNVSNGDNRTNCPNTATSWGVNIDSANRLVLFTSPTSTAQWTWVATGTNVTVLIGSNATFQGTGSAWITNPSGAGTYTITLGGTSGNTGNFLVSIEARLSLTPSLVQAVKCFKTSAGIATCPSLTTSVNTTIIAVVGCSLATCTQGALPSDGTNTYTQIVNCTGNAEVAFAWEADNVAAGTWTVTLNIGGTNAGWDGWVAAYSGLQASAFDKSSCGSGSGGTAMDSGATAMTTAPNELVLGYGNATAGGTVQAGTGFTLRDTETNHYYDILEDNNGTSAGTYNATATAGAASTWNMIVATFKAAVPSISLSAGIAETLTLTLTGLAGSGTGGMNSCSSNGTTDAEDGAAINLINTTAATVPFGTLGSANTFYEGCQKVSVTTNAGNGHTITTREDHSLRTASGLVIADTACDASGCLNTPSTAAAWVTNTNSGLGISCAQAATSASCWTASPNWINGTRWAPLASEGQNNPTGGAETPAIFSGLASATGVEVITKAKYRVAVPNSQPAGTYTNLVSFIATPVY